MAKLENYEKTVTTGLKVGATAALYTVAAEVTLNRTGMSAPAKGAAVAATGVVGGLLLAGHAPNVAAGLIVGGIVYASQTASRAAKLEARIDELFSQKVAAAEQAAQQAQQQQPQQAPAPNPAPGGALPAGRQRMTMVGGRQGAAAVNR